MTDQQKLYLVNKNLKVQEKNIDDYIFWHILIWIGGGGIACIVFYVSFGKDFLFSIEIFGFFIFSIEIFVYDF